MTGKSRESKQLSVPDYMHLLFPQETLCYFDWLKADIKEGDAKYLGEFGFDDQYPWFSRRSLLFLLKYLNWPTEEQSEQKGIAIFLLQIFPSGGERLFSDSESESGRFRENRVFIRTAIRYLLKELITPWGLHFLNTKIGK